MQQALVVTASSRYRYGVYAVAALVALLQPLMTPFVPSLAGWLPGHQHVYVGGLPTTHSHPWDDMEASVEPEPQGVPAGYVFHLCEIHPDGLVPIENTPSGPSVGEPESATAAPVDAHDVAFTFDLGVSSVFLPVPSATPPVCQGALIADREAVYSSGTSFAAHPTSPPPRL